MSIRLPLPEAAIEASLGVAVNAEVTSLDVATETLYSRESPESAGLNSQVANCRLAALFVKSCTNPAANISIVGYLSKTAWTATASRNFSRMVIASRQRRPTDVFECGKID